MVALKHAALPGDRGVLNPLLEKWQDGVRTVPTAQATGIAQCRISQRGHTSSAVHSSNLSVCIRYIPTGIDCCCAGCRHAGVRSAGGAGRYSVQMGCAQPWVLHNVASCQRCVGALHVVMPPACTLALIR